MRQVMSDAGGTLRTSQELWSLETTPLARRRSGKQLCKKCWIPTLILGILEVDNFVARKEQLWVLS
jgi:hypothetical protein